jgi:uncharacterized protein (TIGR02186 family)
MRRTFDRLSYGLTGIVGAAPLAAAFLVLALPATAKPSAQAAKERVRSDVSTREVEIQSNFTGIEIVVFGAIDNARTSPDAPYDVIAVIRGPTENFVVRRKQRLAGVWLNGRSKTFYDVPSFYAVLSTRPLRAIATETVLKSLNIGYEGLDLDRGKGGSESDELFSQALIRLKQGRHLFQDDDDGITFVGQSLFRGTVDLPVNVPIGLYTTQVYLFRSGKLLSEDDNTLQVQKVGFERLVYSLAYRHRILYGLAAVILALVMGLLAWALFRRE